ncbi:hypothetical protein LSAT2_003714 [Lamellibrachia satsuma]|nr:hypothetical protein LSAT2_003714 [Lamellibrachia satsuma]
MQVMWPLLLPYGIFVIVHAVFGRNKDPASSTLRRACLQCLPVAYLALVLTSAGAIHKHHEQRIYFLLLAACLSAASDLCLVFDRLLLPGVLSMCAARITCTVSFGFSQPPKYDIGIMFLLGMIALLLFFLPTIKSIHVCIGIGCYAVLLNMLAWRSVAACYHSDHEVAPLAACAGALLIVFSDVGCAFRTCGYRLQRVVALLVLMAYFTGQALLALSVLIPSWEQMQFGGVL